jgi:hypothetical protein
MQIMMISTFKRERMGMKDLQREQKKQQKWRGFFFLVKEDAM